VTTPSESSLVLVTGANGHLGYNLVQRLLARGYRVRAGVRDPRDGKKIAPLVALGAEPVAAELSDRDALLRAAHGVDGVFHVAAVLQMWARDPENEIVRPTVDGMRNVLEAASTSNVRRVVITSSIAAVGVEGTRERPLTESDWHQNPRTPYAAAKTRAEQLAWEIAERDGLDVVSIIPATIIGPGFHRHTPITTLFELVLRGWMPVALPADTSYVDARDVADAQIRAFEAPTASGRYIASAAFLPMRELLRLIAAHAPEVRVPRFVLPVALLPPLITIDWVVHKLFSFPRQLTREMFEEFGGKRTICSATRLETDLGWRARSMEETVSATVDWVRARFLR
jgi:dihydroflavonol-4-reductase